MQLLNAALVFTLSAVVAAAPAPAPYEGAYIADPSEIANNTLVERSGGPKYHIVTYCQHANRGGKCYNTQMRDNLCFNFDNWWNDRISSLYFQNRAVCSLYMNYNCHGVVQMIDSPGTKNVANGNVGMNDKASSIRCRYW